jgi:hypothetical protein
MIFTTRQQAFIASALFSSTAAGYQWPDLIVDVMDLFLYQLTGFQNNAFAVPVTPCDNYFAGSPSAGRQSAAEWLRTAFHDMATHDAHTGRGGLDGSISFETQRDENKGPSFNDTMNFFVPFMSVRSSMADMIAAGAVVAVRACAPSQMTIPFRAGRIDAPGPGPTGVPEPQQSLNTHIGQFAKAGFNKTEMIALVACGHTFGGVHEEEFPDIVPGASSVSNHIFTLNPFTKLLVRFRQIIRAETLALMAR